MGYSSPPDLLVLHAVRILGMADSAAVVRRFRLDPAVAEELLLDFEASGWIQRVRFADISDWALTNAGRAEGLRRLAAELDQTGARPAVATAYSDFDQLNKSFLEVITNWQIRPTRDDSMARNDHSDQAWDERYSTPWEGSTSVFVPCVRSCSTPSIVSTATPTDSPLPSIALTWEMAHGLPGSGSTPATRSGSSFMRTLLDPQL